MTASETAVKGDDQVAGDRSAVRRAPPLIMVAVVVAVLPILAAIPRVLSKGAFALNGDVALIELHVRDVGTRATPLVGPYQRFGFNHPGPTLYYLLAAPYRLLGSRYAGLQVGALLINAGALVGAAVIAFRRGGALLALWALIMVSGLAFTLGPSWLADPWGPYIVVMPLALLIMLAAEVASGRRAALPVAAAVATVVTQVNAVLIPTAVGLGLWALAAWVVGAYRRRGEQPPREEWRASRRMLLVTVGVLAVLWLPPVIDQVNGEGNVTLMREFASSSQPKLGLGDAFKAVSLQLDGRPPWLNRDFELVGIEADLDAAPAVPLALIVLIGATVLAAVRRRGHAAILGATVLVAVGASVVGFSQLTGEAFPWLFQWTKALGAMTWVASGWCLYRSLARGSTGRAASVLLPLLALGVLAAATVNLVDAVTRDDEANVQHEAAVELAEKAVAATRGVDGPVLVTTTADADTVFGHAGFGEEELALALDRAGHEVMVDPSRRNRFGPHRAEPETAAFEVRLVSGPDRPEGFDVVDSMALNTPGQRREREELLDVLAARWDGDSLEELSRLAERDPELRDAIERLKEIPNLPALTLLARPLPAR